jgi:ATP synthase F1 gamma subunit
MSRLTELRQQLEEYGAAELTAGALEDISAIRMQAIRNVFEKNRAFFEGIRDLYGTVQKFATKKEATLGSQKHLYVAITSNKRFYGSLMRDVITSLQRALAASPGTSALVVGRVGWQYFAESGYSQARQFVAVDDALSPQEFEKLMEYFNGYDRVFVLYPKFINPFRQDVAIEDITQSPEADLPAKEKATPKKEGEVLEPSEYGYLFEPEVSQILEFFDAQVKRVLLEGVLLEAELARTAARLVRMEEAQERAHEKVVKAAFRVRRENASVSNAQLLETFAGYSKWQRT